MSSRLTEIEALIEAEVEARVEARLAQRMGALAQSLRSMANRVDPSFKPIEIVMTGVGVSPVKLPSTEEARGKVEGAQAEERAAPVQPKTPDPAPERPKAPPAPAPKRIDPPADGPGGNEVPEGSPDWLAPVLALLRPQKEKDIARRIAAEGGVSLQEVIYHFRPPIKETYATVILSNVRTALKRGGMSLARDAEGVYRVRAEP